MERRTDAWADLTACSGGAARTVAARLGRKHPRSAESHQSPILPPSPLNGGGTDRLTGEPEERHGERGWGESDSLGGSNEESWFLRLLTSVRDEAQQHHIWRKGKTGGEKHSLWQLTLIALPCSSIQESFILCFHQREAERRIAWKIQENIFYPLHQLSWIQKKNFCSSQQGEENGETTSPANIWVAYISTEEDSELTWEEKNYFIPLSAGKKGQRFGEGFLRLSGHLRRRKESGALCWETRLIRCVADLNSSYQAT